MSLNFVYLLEFAYTLGALGGVADGRDGVPINSVLRAKLGYVCLAS